MAIIGKIRERSGLLLVLVGGAMVAFILTDLFSNRGIGLEDRAVGVIDGEDVGIIEFERRVSDELDSYRNDFGQTVDAQVTEQVRATVWNEILRERTLLRQAEAAGFGSSLGKEEYDDIRFGNNVLQEFSSNPNFKDPNTGQLNKEQLRTYFENVQLNAPVYHGIQKRRMIQNRLITKYTTLVKKSVFVNTTQVQDEHLQKTAKASFEFVAKRYDSEPDSLYQVTESELKSFYDAHKNEKRYVQKAARAFDYVAFPVVATMGDIEQIRKDLEELRNDFEATADDSLFVVGNSDDRTYALQPYTSGTADAAQDTLILAADTGAVIGPYRDGDSWKLVKVKEIGKVEEARVRHILLSTQSGKPEDEVEARADSILKVVKRDRSKFEALVTKYSEDPGSVQNGGVYEWFDRFKMVPEFTAASFDEQVGAITIAKTTYGFHVVEVLDQREREEPRLAVITRNIRPLPATFKEVYKTANEFSLNNTTAEAFKSAAEEAGLQFVEVDELRNDQRFVQGLEDPFSLITWVNNADIDEVSEPIESGDRYVVARLRGIREQGAPDLEDVRELFTKEAIKEKKANAWIEKMNGASDLATLASELGGSVSTATDLAFNSFNIPGGYSENAVIGRIFAVPEGQVSAPLKGDIAVYVVKMNTVTPAPELTDAEAERTAMRQRLQGRSEGNLFTALREAAGVQDLRSKYY
ncbi:MAG: peptidylprolyl isomerase [Flavobacteriales bacterium]|nr:peptidylprolyl isomerase [Flavobacteriales bacterium]